MKKYILVLLIAIITLSFTQSVKYVSWQSKKYMILDDYGIHKYNGSAFCIYNDKYCAFYCSQTGLNIFEMQMVDTKMVKNQIVTDFVAIDRNYTMTLKVPNEIQIMQTTGYSRTYIFSGLVHYDNDYDKFISSFKNKK